MILVNTIDTKILENATEYEDLSAKMRKDYEEDLIQRLENLEYLRKSLSEFMSYKEFLDLSWEIQISEIDIQGISTALLNNKNFIW